MSKQPLTKKQRDSLNELVAGSSTLKEAMVKGGYSVNTARAPTKFTKSPAVQEELKGVVEQLKEERQRAINLMKSKITKAQYHHLTGATDIFTKNIELLSGNPTDITKNTELESLREEIKNLTESVKANGQ